MAKHLRLLRKLARLEVGLDCQDRCKVQFTLTNDKPKLTGNRYWKTHFTRGNFSKYLYTPSSRLITVGINWCPK